MTCHPTLCGMTVTLSDGHKVSISGDNTNPDCKAYLCMHGKSVHEIVRNKRRLLTPHIRKSRFWPDRSDVTRDAALDQIAETMRDVDRERIGFQRLHGNWANDYVFGLMQAQMGRFDNLYGGQFWPPAMICWGLGPIKVGITGALETSTKEDPGDNSKKVILQGANTVGQANILRHIEIAKRFGARIIVIDVRRSEVSALAHEVILAKPAADAALALAMMQAMR